MSESEICSNILNLTTQQAQQDRIVKELIEAMIDLDLVKVEHILDNYIGSNSIASAIIDIFFPFLERIGILWVTNHINPAQEHLVTNIIRQKIIVGIESTKTSPASENTVLLFLPESEYHELGLLFIYYLLKQKGVPVLYLGANVPLKDVEYIVNLKKPSLLISHITSIPNNFQFERYVGQLGKKFPNTPVTLSGFLAQQYKKDVPDNIALKRSLREVLSYISSI
jgi:methanogenic corrinoid protein MtbC1